VKYPVMPIALCVLGLGVTTARADLVTYAERANAVGLFDSTLFSGEITLSFVSDTRDIKNVSPGLYEDAVGTLTIAVAGIGIDTLTDQAAVFVNQSLGFAGISDYTVGGADIIDTVAGAFNANNAQVFSTYDLTTNIGPITDISEGPFLTNYPYNFRYGVTEWQGATAIYSFPTTRGTLTLINGDESTFTATLSPSPELPEPSFIIPTTVILLSIVFVAWKRCSQGLLEPR
jgi:hypothetical protein